MKTILFMAASLIAATPAFAYCPPPNDHDNGPPGRPIGYYVGSDCGSHPWAYNSSSPIVSGSWASLYHDPTTASATPTGPRTN